VTARTQPTGGHRTPSAAGLPPTWRPAARTVLAGIDDGDLLILDTLPTLHILDPDEAAEIYRDSTSDDAPPWASLNNAGRQEAIDAYRDGYDQAAADRVASHCRNAEPHAT